MAAKRHRQLLQPNLMHPTRPARPKRTIQMSSGPRSTSRPRQETNLQQRQTPSHSSVLGQHRGRRRFQVQISGRSALQIQKLIGLQHPPYRPQSVTPPSPLETGPTKLSARYSESHSTRIGKRTCTVGSWPSYPAWLPSCRSRTPVRQYDSHPTMLSKPSWKPQVATPKKNR